MSLNNAINDVLIQEAKQFLIKSFTENPSYSFGDDSIMIEHSINVANLCLNLAVYYDYDPTTLALGGMFHDIGKSILIDGKPVDPVILRDKHETFNYPMMKEFLSGKVDDNVLELLKDAFDPEGDSDIKHLVKDADIIEFYMNYRLQKALKEWGDKEGFFTELQKKADKFEKVLWSEKSKEMARPFWEVMKLRWNLQ